MYIVNMYQRENIYIFDLIIYDDRREKKHHNSMDLPVISDHVVDVPSDLKINLLQSSH